MNSRSFIFLLFVSFTLCSHSPQASAVAQSFQISVQTFSPFSIALDNLQSQINYIFKSFGLLRRAMTHASYSEENNKALSVLGGRLIEASFALQLLTKNVDISTKDLNRLIVEIDNVENSCAADGTHLGLQKIVRVSPKTNSTSPSVVCGAFRAIFGAIAVDTGSLDEAGRVFWKVHKGGIGRAVAM
ncbi:Protein NUCLEAR FUSION DEFECTIVE 2 [Forsythia ovata]|uniref:Protein NUCLEAR FUSION DEFECTIVE 2 n=1 Tax=Forsythia ovata TaxID=205694 RepID=A0ABD1TST7_9LAMI